MPHLRGRGHRSRAAHPQVAFWGWWLAMEGLRAGDANGAVGEPNHWSSLLAGLRGCGVGVAAPGLLLVVRVFAPRHRAVGYEACCVSE